MVAQKKQVSLFPLGQQILSMWKDHSHISVGNIHTFRLCIIIQCQFDSNNVWSTECSKKINF